MSRLRLELNVQGETFEAGAEIPALLRLVNSDDTPVEVPPRLRIGYPDSIEREVFLEIELAAGAPYEGWRAFQIDYMPDPDLPEPVALAAGEAIETRVDLGAWYLQSPGDYVVRAVYAPTGYRSAVRRISLQTGRCR